MARGAGVLRLRRLGWERGRLLLGPGCWGVMGRVGVEVGVGVGITLRVWVGGGGQGWMIWRI
jgi:hypothetical protein